MNNTRDRARNLIVILNDNEMSIAPPVGAMSSYLSRLYAGAPFQDLKAAAKSAVSFLPQPFQAGSFSSDVAAVLTTFVQDGGGLISSHNSVGFRGVPVVCHEVCAKGLVNVADSGFKASADHPVTKGLPLGQPLQASYYDYITIQPGPAGTVVCRGLVTSEPMVVCGAVGKGRYVACGLALGLCATDDADCAPTPDETVLLENAVRCYAEKLEAEQGLDVLSHTSGAWQREESAAQTVGRSKEAMRKSQERHKR